MGKFTAWIVRTAFVGLGAMVLAVFVPITLAHAGNDLMIIKWLKPKVSLYESADGSSKTKVARGSLELGVVVEKIAPNKRMRITIDGKQFWVSPRHAKTNKTLKITSDCAVVAMVDTTAARGAGEGCN